MLKYKAGYKYVDSGVHAQVLDFPAAITCASGNAPTPGTVATPEPATAILTGIGGLGALGFRLFKRRRLK